MTDFNTDVTVVFLENYKRLKSIHSCIVNSDHDSSVIDIHPDEQKEVINVINDVNDSLNSIIDNYYGIKMNVPLLLEAKIGPNWLDTKDVM